MRVEVKQVGRPCSGEYIAENVTHRLDPDEGYITEFSLKRNTVEESFGKRNTAVDRHVDEAFRAGKAAKEEAETQMQTKEKEGPEYRSLKWKKDGKEIAEALVDDTVAITFEVKNIPDGETVKITIWESDEGEENPDDKIEVVEGKVVKGAVTVDWKVIYTEDNDDTNSAKELEEKGYTLPEYYFVAEYNGVESEQGKLLFVKGWAKLLVVDEAQEIAANRKCTIFFADKSERKCVSDENGYVYLDRLLLGKVSVRVFDEKKEN